MQPLKGIRDFIAPKGEIPKTLKDNLTFLTP